MRAIVGRRVLCKREKMKREPWLERNHMPISRGNGDFSGWEGDWGAQLRLSVIITSFTTRGIFLGKSQMTRERVEILRTGSDVGPDKKFR